MIESELLYINSNIQHKAIDYDEYKEIIDKIDQHILKEEHSDSNAVKLLKGVKEFLLNFPLDCIRDVSIGPAYASILYDCTYSNKNIGTYGLVVNFEYWNSTSGEVFFDTSFEVTSHNQKKQYTVGWKDKAFQTMEINKIKEACLLNNWSNLELNQRLNNYSENYKFEEDFSAVVTKAICKEINNKYLQIYYSQKGKEEYLIELTPKVILNNKYSPSSLEIRLNDDNDVIVELKAGVDASKSNSFHIEHFKNLIDNKEDWEKEFEKRIKEIVQKIRESKSLLYSYSINSFSDKIFSHKVIK